MAEPVKYTWAVLSQYPRGARGMSEEGVRAATEQEARRMGRKAGLKIVSVTTDWVPVTNPPLNGPAGQEYQAGDREVDGTITGGRPYNGGTWIYTLGTAYGETETYGDDVYYLHPAGGR
jgi:hypothetical protein